jgi:AcrR family transcriptional regulator
MTPRAKRINQLKNVILDKAEEVFARNGYKATTMQDIADALQMTRTPLNYHFKNKKVLYEAVVRRWLTRRRADYEQMYAQSDCFSDLVWRHLLHCRDEEMGTLRLLDGLTESGFQELNREVETEDAYLRSLKEHFTRRAIDSGELRADLDVDALVNFLYVQYYGLLRVAMDLPPEHIHRQIDCVADMLLSADIWGPASGHPKQGRFEHEGLVQSPMAVSL